MPKSLPYHPLLIESLKNPIDSAMYLEALFEEENPEAELLKMVLSNVAEALGQSKMTPEQYELHLKKLDELLSEQGSDAIYSLGIWLKTLGLKLTVAVCTDTEDNDVNAEMPAQLTV
ncbi:MAG: transcriptional regulator [Oscillatoriales cyanobacterium]|uniref:Transcriptional regulator n=1 Tax=Microcoleus anatoxicus PTRS2 TaxID=2705321 RepID=A0ABU8YX03_9CYAN|nr:MAG: transcriptional regulator [Oscillatoriales cyanobacterium]TAD95787.1 MAG: transcriptional regulator [Oscillatoriales cyanobacterium]TAE03833.1 MAG: transcriptional regulator [Oscillatoriales cyanobacterium]